MVFYPFEVTTPHVIYALLGAFIVLFGMFSLLLRERLYIGEAIWAFLFGVIIGPYCADVFNPRAWSGNSEEVTNVITLEFTRVVLAIGVFAIGVELPKAYMKKHWRSLFFLLVPVMTWGWFVCAGLIYALIPGLNFLSSLAVAACLTPTDPILAAAVVGGKWADKHVPTHLRHLLAAESGCNDGAAFPFLFLALYLIINKTTGSAIRDWFLILWLYQVVLGAVIGCLLGWGFRHLMKFCQRHDLIDRHSYVAQYVSLAILTIGVTTLLGSDDLLAAFFCGTAFAWDGFFNKQTEESVFSSVIDILFNIAAFIFVGAWMPFDKFDDPALTLSVWRLIVIALLVLLLRRLPIMIALYKWIPDVKTFREAIFSGHFGPIGIGAVFISTLALEVLHNAQEEAGSSSSDAAHETGELTQTEILQGSMQPIVAFMVLCSITIHGLSIPGFSLGRRVHSVSRTWSRRETYTSASGRSGHMPEWATQARIVRRGEDIVINRDQADLEVGEKASKSGGSTDVDVEVGQVSTIGGGGRRGSAESSEETKLHLSDTLVPPTPAEPVVTDEEDEKEVGLPMPVTTPTTRSGRATPIRMEKDEGLGTAGMLQRPPLVTLPVPALTSRVPSADSGLGREKDYRDQTPPDGTEMLAEWKEGNHRVIERRTGPGSDVEVTVINEDPHASNAFVPITKLSGKIPELEHGAEEIAHSLYHELGELGKKAKHAVLPDRSYHASTSAEGSSTTATRLSVDMNSAVVDDEDEEDEEGWASEGSNGRPAASGFGFPQRKNVKRTVKGGPHLHGHQHVSHPVGKGRRRPSFRRGSQSHGSSGGIEIVEEPRGRSGPVAPSSITFALNTSAGNAPHPDAAPSSSRLAGPGPVARPGTADSAARNNRIESIRALHSRPPTRENSPSRSVRFVDEGRAGSGSASAQGSGGTVSAGAGAGQAAANGRTFLDSPLVSEPAQDVGISGRR